MLRLIGGLAIAALSILPARSQILLNINWSDLSAVSFTATGTVPIVNDSGSATYSDGIDVVGFLTHTVTFDHHFGGPATVSTLQTGTNSSVAFNDLTTWNNASPNTNTDGADINFFNGTDNTAMTYSTGTAAFSGVSTWDMSSDSDITQYFPALNTTGNLYLSGTSIIIGQWKVTGADSAVPEPATYAALLGLAALLAASSFRRRRQC